MTDADGSHPDTSYEAYASEPSEGSAKCPSFRSVIPLGALLVATAAVPCSVIAALYVAITECNMAVFQLLRLTTHKYMEYTAEKASAGGISVALALCNWYIGWYFLTLVVIFVLWVLLILLIPCVLILHAVFAAARATYNGSDMAEMAAVKEGFLSALLDSADLMESAKERLAEKIASDCPYGGEFLLRLGDFLLLTGIADGASAAVGTWKLWQTIMRQLANLFGLLAAAEETSIFGIDLDVMPLELIFKKAGPAIKSKVEEEIRKEDEAKKLKEEAKRKKKEERKGKKGFELPEASILISIFCLIFALAFWTALALRLSTK